MKVKKVLVVDNHPLVRRMISSRLEKLGHGVRTAADGLAALDVLKGFVPDLIFVDLVMPNIDGGRICRIVRSRPQLAGVCLVIISSVAAEVGLDPADYGADACIAKSGQGKISAHLDTILQDLENHGRILPEHRVLGVDDVFGREITRELLSLQKHHEVVLQNMSDGLVELDCRGRIIYVNSSGLAMFACREEELLGAEIYAHLEPEPARILRALVADPAVRPLNLADPWFLTDRQTQVGFYPVREGSRRSFVLLFHDITEARAVESALRRTSDNLRQSLAELKSAQDVMIRQEKLASIGTMAAGVAHEILNPLNIIGTIIQLLQMEEEMPARFKPRFAEVMEQIRRATKITNSLRIFSRRHQPEIKEVDIHALLDNTLALVRHELESDNIQVAREFTPDLPAVAADPDQLAQVFLNLISNARDAMKQSQPRRLTLATSLVEQGVGLAVRDTGCGIAASELSKIFDPFFTTKDPGSGTGMGLAIVHSIVENQGGFIEVSSRPGEGAEFFIVLPPNRPKTTDREGVKNG
ncbi:ATP-binding protein [Desulfurivibrio sp. D14AmB]|uniref:ATP-binding protein n=1 Tax=Desulfurivibrio sp. D14AmB TaxID=3374370 RepID=UPI00376ECF0C